MVYIFDKPDINIRSRIICPKDLAQVSVEQLRLLKLGTRRNVKLFAIRQ